VTRVVDAARLSTIGAGDASFPFRITLNQCSGIAIQMGGLPAKCAHGRMTSSNVHVVWQQLRVLSRVSLEVISVAVLAIDFEDPAGKGIYRRDRYLLPLATNRLAIFNDHFTLEATTASLAVRTTRANRFSRRLPKNYCKSEIIVLTLLSSGC
jgi:hypothetical protein